MVGLKAVPRQSLERDPIDLVAKKSKRADRFTRARPVLAPVVRLMVTAGISANAVTLTCCALGAMAGILVARGQFGGAAMTIALASIGDALDGDLARARGSVSPEGAILDATVDRYEEFFFLTGLVILFRDNAIAMALALSAMLGSFMISYGSAKAEGYGVPVPASTMRRAGRALCLVVGTALVPLAQVLAARGVAPAWSTHVPILAALGVVGVLSNISAVTRFRAIGRAASRAHRASPSTPVTAAQVVDYSALSTFVCSSTAHRDPRISSSARSS
jgi:phosphatidylglycerophosphate synthase